MPLQAQRIGFQICMVGSNEIAAYLSKTFLLDRNVLKFWEKKTLNLPTNKSLIVCKENVKSLGLNPDLCELKRSRKLYSPK